MIPSEAITWSDRCYFAVLSLYPAEFRIRFGKEMVQLFRDCRRDAVEQRGFAGLLDLWLRTICDHGCSLARERARLLTTAEDRKACASALIDSFVIGAIIGFHLVIGGTAIAAYIHRWYGTSAGFMTLAALASSALGCIGVASSLVVARFRRIHYRFIELD